MEQEIAVTARSARWTATRALVDSEAEQSGKRIIRNGEAEIRLG